MRKLVLVLIAILTISCSEDGDVAEKYPSLKVINKLNDSWRSISGVSLIGYEFDNLNIEPNGNSQTFLLDKGMSGGYEDINIIVRYIRYSGISASAKIKVDFNESKTTTITLTGCSGAEGCPGIYLDK